jgi:uncharacterized membrane protein YhhN
VFGHLWENLRFIDALVLHFFLFINQSDFSENGQLTVVAIFSLTLLTWALKEVPRMRFPVTAQNQPW